SIGAGRVQTPVLDAPAPTVEPSRVPSLQTDPDMDWAKYNREYWLDNHEDFLWFFFGQVFSEPHSTKPIEDCVGWGLETTGAVLVAESRAERADRDTIARWHAQVDTPVLAIHGDEDRIMPLRRSEDLIARSGGDLMVMEGAGHIPLARDPVRVNLEIRDFVE